MKIVTRNVRAPRKYSEFNSVYLMDDAGIIWGTIQVRDGAISIRHLGGVTLHTQVVSGMGDYLIGDDGAQRYRLHSIHYSDCPNCVGSNPKVYDTKTDKVKCSKCGHTWGAKEGGG